MNKLPVYLYPNLLEVILDLDQNRRIHKIMYQRKIKIQKGFTDSIQIQFKNSDQKPVSISTGTFFMDIIGNDNRQLFLSKPLAIQESTTTTGTSTTIVSKGIAIARFDPEDTIQLTAGNYKFVVKQQNDDGTYTPAYSNTYYGISGDIEIVEEGFPVGYPIQTVDFATLETSRAYDRNIQTMGFFFSTGWIRPVTRLATTSSTSTAVVTLSGFKGTITAFGTLDNSPSNLGNANSQEFTINTWTYATQTTSIEELELGSGYTAVKLVVRPSSDGFGSNYYPNGFPIGSGTNKFPNGFIDQIQYRS